MMKGYREIKRVWFISSGGKKRKQTITFLIPTEGILGDLIIKEGTKIVHRIPFQVYAHLKKIFKEWDARSGQWKKE